MPLIKEIENVLPFFGELPESLQKPIALMMSRAVVAHDNMQTMTFEERMALAEKDREEWNMRMFGKKSLLPKKKRGR